MPDDNSPPASPAAPPPLPPENTPAQSTFLTDLRDKVASGESVYGDPKSPRAIEKLQELDARIALGRRLGEIATAPEPRSEARAARERLAHEFPADPTAPMAEGLAAHLAKQIDDLGRLDARQAANLAQQVADDFGNRTSLVSARHSLFNRGSDSFPPGSQIVEGLLKDAEPAVNASVEPGKVDNAERF